MNLRRIAARLRPHGVRVVAALRESSANAVLGDHAIEILAAPRWPIDALAAAQRPALSSATLNDILSGLGLADSAAVGALLGAWDDMIARIRPDLVIADFAPLAALAARGRVPLVQIGNGYTLPPHAMPRFPPLHRFAPPLWREEQTLDSVNRALRAAGRAPLERLPQLFAGDACRVQTFALFDPYDTQRTEAVDGPLLEGPPAIASADADSIFVYLSGGYALHPALPDALASFAPRLRLHAPSMPAAQAEALHRQGARIDAAPVPLAEILPATRLLVHNGGPGVAAEALVAGVPQLVLSAQVEQDFNGQALERIGVGRFVRAYAPEAEITADLIAALLADQALAARAAAEGARYRADLARLDALGALERSCLGLMGL